MYNQIDGSDYYLGSRTNRGNNPKNTNKAKNILEGLL